MIDTDELMALLAKATAGPLSVYVTTENDVRIMAFDAREPDFPWHFATTEWDCDEASAHDNAAAIVAAVNFCRTELPALIAERDALREALAPSADTKAAYIGEFHFNVIDRDEDGEEVPRRVAVPWDVTKEIMAAISARAALAGQP